MSQLTFFGGGSEGEAYDLPDASVVLHRGFLSENEARGLLSKLLVLPGWRQDTIRIFGRVHAIPRLHRWFADSGHAYRWSGITMTPEPFPACVRAYRERLHSVCGITFNTALANLYRDGRDSVSWHADDEPDLGDEPVIASLSLGEERVFQLRRKDDHQKRVSIALPHGSLLVMAGPTQKFWEHALPRRTRQNQPRVNLTFRNIVSLS